PTARDLLRLRDVVGSLDEGERDPVDAGIEPRFEVGTVLCRQRRERHGGVGQVDAFAIGQLSADLDAGENAVAVRLDDDESYVANDVKQGVARLYGGKDSGVRQVHPLGITGSGIGVEREGFAVGQRDRICCEAADPELWTLQIEQNSDWPTVLGLHLPDSRRE